MTIPGTLAQWRAWTGLPFDTSGSVDVPGALVPVMCAAEHDVAVYVEPNIWVHHYLATDETRGGGCRYLAGRNAVASECHTTYRGAP
jgi:hypothetical protein